MEKKRMYVTVGILIGISVIIYALQIIIFDDRRTTAFYIFQDLAFMPITIAIATLVVGDLVNRREQKEQQEKTRMLTSSFFTQMGADLLDIMMRGSSRADDLTHLMQAPTKDDKDVQRVQSQLQSADLGFTLSADIYDESMDIILKSRQALLTLSSNPLLLEHECFTEMLWGIFHLSDEFRLRGNYKELDEDGREHMEDDFEKVFRLLLVNRVANLQYLQKTYPNYYSASLAESKDAANVLHGSVKGN